MILILSLYVDDLKDCISETKRRLDSTAKLYCCPAIVIAILGLEKIVIAIFASNKIYISTEEMQ